MALIIEPKPFMLYETVEMVCAYVNHESMAFHRDRMNRGNKEKPDGIWYRRLTRLQEIMEMCCGDLNRDDSAVQHFFRKMETGNTGAYAYLAVGLTQAFMLYQSPDFDEEIQALKTHWRRLQEEGFTLQEFGGGGLNIAPLNPEEENRPLHLQIYDLDYPPELRLELLTAYLSYDRELDALAELLRPYALRLQNHYAQEPWLMDSTVAYWQEQFRTMTPEEFFRKGLKLNEELREMAERRVCFSLMGCGQVAVVLREPEGEMGYGLFIMGCAAMINFGILDSNVNIEQVLSKIRSISDWNKFEILRRLSRQESYCQKLADELDCHTGNISRNLTTLWKDGFLTRREGENRVYYETNAEELAKFFKKVYVILADRDLV